MNYHSHECTCTAENAEHISTIKSNLLASLGFDSGNYIPKTTEDFSLLRDSLLDALGSEEVLVIHGSAGAEEIDQDANLGLKRANAIRTLFDGYLDLSRIKIAAADAVQHGQYITFEVQAADDAKDKVNDVNNVSPMSDATLTATPSYKDVDYVIYFKDNSTAIVGEQEVIQYLDALAQRVKKSKEKILVEGFDDSGRTPSESLQLTKRRTWKIRKAFKDNYVRRHLVELKNTGQVATANASTSADAQAEHRRIEIKIVKK